MNNVLPHEIIKNSYENHFSKFNSKSRIIYCGASFIIFLIGISLFFIKVDINVLSRGVIRFASAPVPITSMVSAEVEKINLEENKFVTAADTLIWLDTEKYQKKISFIQDHINKNRSYIHDLNILPYEKSEDLLTGLFRTVYEEYNQKINELNLNIEILEKSYCRALILYNKGVIPLADKEKEEFHLINKIEEKRILIKQNRKEWRNLSDEYEKTNNDFQNEINLLKEQIKNHFILSPVSGYISNYNGIKKGSYVSPGNVVAIISPLDTLITENLVPPGNIGYLKTGMSVKYQIDSYNYTEWGMASGKIIDISNKIFLIKDQPFFKVRCDINETHLSLKNGYKGKIKNGLTTTTCFKVSQRTLAELIFDKTDNWLNPNTINEH